eukprot:CAMPEP_0197046654 /NCGR_PEP_ID=MMETSP1384-20130603/22341_1 /TAXON_ID=29189 /ORGANISM="Ammonia sp." /LENGTH=209 /DNA_ID=CAMNT_0042478487 /DNA_START=1 /DNA_END=627 /DNA_ORIENTATION=+
MNTPIRRAIFCIVMDSDDYIDAFQKLMQLNIDNKEHTEIVRIILLLCMRQNAYNQYFALLLEKIMKERRAWKFALHCAFWDRFNEVEELSSSDLIHLAKLLSDLIHCKCLNLVVLKRMDIMKATPKNLLFVSTLFTHLLNRSNANEVHHVFASLAGNKKLVGLKQDIEIFFNTVLIPRTKTEIASLKRKHKEAQDRYKENKVVTMSNVK